jgi:hypothetical protein
VFNSGADDLLVALDAGDPPLPALYRALEQLAAATGVRQLVVAVDDPQWGRQLFSSDRRIVPSSLALICEASVWTEPSVVIPRDLENRLVASVGTAYRRARQPPGLTTKQNPLLQVDGAVARAVRYGWGFTLVCVGIAGAVPPGGVTGIRQSLRGGDIVVATNDTELVLVLESARDEEVPAILARVAAPASRVPVSFGLVHCPGDGTDTETLIGKARSRLAEVSLAETGRAGARVADAGEADVDQPEASGTGTRLRGTRRARPAKPTLRAAGGYAD